MSKLQLSSKQRIANQFSKAAARYDLAAEVQADIAADNLDKMPGNLMNTLDIGCGTGRVTGKLLDISKNVWAVDIAQGMLQYAQQTAPDPIYWIAADAEQLPFQSGSFEGVFSSMALQWCEDFGQVFSEIRRILGEHGLAQLAIMSDGSFHQLNQCWQAIDSKPHTNRFPAPEALVMQASKAGFTVKQQVKTYTTWHQTVRSMLGSIKSIGANVVTRTNNQSVITKQSLQELEKQYRYQFMQKGLLPLDYNVCFLSLMPKEV